MPTEVSARQPRCRTASLLQCLISAATVTVSGRVTCRYFETVPD